MLTVGLAQDADDFAFEVYQVYKPLSISRTAVMEADSLSDLNEFYKPQWVKRYVGVEITAVVAGEERSAFAKSDVLSSAQKEIMLNADNQSDIKVRVEYWPDNQLSENKIRQMGFDFMINPDTDASYDGGKDALNQFLVDKAISRLDREVFGGQILGTFNFTISPTGEVIDIEMTDSCEDAETDQLFLDALCAMEVWSPAQYRNGETVAQHYVLTVGNTKSCKMNLLNIRQGQK